MAAAALGWYLSGIQVVESVNQGNQPVGVSTALKKGCVWWSSGGNKEAVGSSGADPASLVGGAEVLEPSHVLADISILPPVALLLICKSRPRNVGLDVHHGSIV